MPWNGVAPGALLADALGLPVHLVSALGLCTEEEKGETKPKTKAKAKRRTKKSRKKTKAKAAHFESQTPSPSLSHVVGISHKGQSLSSLLAQASRPLPPSSSPPSPTPPPLNLRPLVSSLNRLATVWA